jgi:hypothetical protein
VAVDDCPRSYVTDESKFLVEMEAENRHIHEATGASLFGPVASRWPAVWWDVVTALQMARIQEGNARNDAMKR